MIPNAKLGYCALKKKTYDIFGILIFGSCKTLSDYAPSVFRRPFVRKLGVGVGAGRRHRSIIITRYGLSKLGVAPTVEVMVMTNL